MVKRYYIAAVANNGAKACSLVYWLFAEAIPEDYGQSPGPPALSGKTCPVVLSKLFRLHHEQLVADAAGLEVTGARVERRRGVVLLRFRGSREPRYIQMHRERHAWKIDALLDEALP